MEKWIEIWVSVKEWVFAMIQTWASCYVKSGNGKWDEESRTELTVIKKFNQEDTEQSLDTGVRMRKESKMNLMFEQRNAKWLAHCHTVTSSTHWKKYFWSICYRQDYVQSIGDTTVSDSPLSWTYHSVSAEKGERLGELCQGDM